ncbi:MAG TPA: ABC transporter permease [Tepidisphaeraceae bacterium]|nr:ABC transporter permease [Tepidisphaeraceae bacterium]
MNPFQLVLKQMRQRALSTWLTLLAVLLGSALAVAVLILQRESRALFTQSDFGYDLIVGSKGSPMQLVLNTTYHVDKSPGNIRYIVYEALRASRGQVRHAVPYAVGDQYKGLRVAGTTAALFGFDELTGQPPAGYDDKGKLLPGYVPASTRADDRPADAKVAADVFEIRFGKKFTIAQGRVFHPRKFEAVIGAEVTGRVGLKIGDTFKVTHDTGGSSALDEHDEEWTVVGVLDKTFTAEDRVIYIPLPTFFAIPKHEEAMDLQTAMQTGEDLSKFDKSKKPATTTTAPATTQSTPATAATAPAAHAHPHKPTTRPTTTQATTTAAAHKHDDDDDDDDDHKGHDHSHHGHSHGGMKYPYLINRDGTIDLRLPKDRWMLSAVLVRTRSASANMGVTYQLANSPSGAMAVNPATVMREFFTTFLGPTTLLLLVIAVMVAVTAAVSILVSIYNAVSARQREIAIMRALGATRGKVLSLICLEAGVIGAVGGFLGLLLGHFVARVLSAVFEAKMGVQLDWLSTSWHEWVYLGSIVVLSVLAGLVPGLKAYRTPVATNLVAA